jgi:transposase
MKFTESYAKNSQLAVNRKEPISLHDNARLHVSQRTLQKLKKLSYETLPPPPYLPDRLQLIATFSST